MSQLNLDALGLPLDKTQLLVDTLSAFFKIKEKQDPNLAQIFTGYPPPRILTAAYKILKREVDLADDESFRYQCQSFLNILIDALNEYDRIPILLEEITAGKRQLPRKTVLMPPTTAGIQSIASGFADEDGAFSEFRQDALTGGTPRALPIQDPFLQLPSALKPQEPLKDGTGFVMDGFAGKSLSKEVNKEDEEDTDDELGNEALF